MDSWDVIIVGGGPAGLSAALVLGRCRRRVLLFDDGRGRNAASHAAHAFFTRDGSPPQELLQTAREQLTRYAVESRRASIEHAVRTQDGFELSAESGEHYIARKLLLATGLDDVLPDVSGLSSCFGRTVFTCPYCDAWEHRDQSLAVLGQGSAAVELAVALTAWSGDVLYCSHGWNRPRRSDLDLLRAHGIVWRRERVSHLASHDGQLQRVVFEDGAEVARSALFVHARTQQRSRLAQHLDCAFDTKGAVKTSRYSRVSAGLYVAGDAAHDANFIAVAVSEGVKAGVAIHKELREEQSALLLHRLHASDIEMRSSGRPAGSPSAR
jgi:thioredoxin reductase